MILFYFPPHVRNENLLLYICIKGFHYPSLELSVSVLVSTVAANLALTALITPIMKTI